MIGGGRRRGRPRTLLDDLLDRLPWLPLALVVAAIVARVVLGR
jgi:hypothetical protein